MDARAHQLQSKKYEKKFQEFRLRNPDEKQPKFMQPKIMQSYEKITNINFDWPNIISKTENKKYNLNRYQFLIIRYLQNFTLKMTIHS